MWDLVVPILYFLLLQQSAVAVVEVSLVAELVVVQAVVLVVGDQIQVVLQHQAKEIMVVHQLQDYVAALVAAVLEEQDQIQDLAQLTLMVLMVVPDQLHHFQVLQ
jgi:hypothetical protein